MLFINSRLFEGESFVHAHNNDTEHGYAQEGPPVKIEKTNISQNQLIGELLSWTKTVQKTEKFLSKYGKWSSINTHSLSLKRKC